MTRNYILIFLISFIVFSLGLSLPVFAAKPSDFNLKDGDLISAIFSSDPDVYIINEHGYKRLFLNPEIFKFYGHLGGFANVKLVTPEVRDSFPTTGLFRNCEVNDLKVYGFQADNEDKGKLRWIDTPGDQAVKDDPDFFKKVFCINKKEFDWYPRGQELKSVKEIPQYHRAVPAVPAIPAIPASPSHLFSPPASKSVSLTPSITLKPASESFSPTPIPTSVIQPATPAVPATPATPATSSPTPTPTPTPTPILTPTPTLTVSPTPTTTASPSFSPTPIPTPIPTPTSTPTPTPIPTPTPTPIACAESYKFVTKWGGWGSANGQVNLPRGITVDSQGYVYVADTSNYRVQKFDSNGNWIKSWGSQGSGNGQFNAPVDVAVDSSGTIYVSEAYNNRVQKFDPNGNWISTFSVTAPNGIGLDNSGNLYVTMGVSGSGGGLKKFDSSGNLLQTIGSQGSNQGQFNGPQDITIDGQENIYVADYFNYRIQKFDSNGNFLTKWSTTGVPSGVVADGTGNLFVAEMSNNYRISKFNSSGSYITSWNNSSGSGGVLTGPWRVAVDAQGNVYVAEIFPAHRIVKFAPCAVSINNQLKTNNLAYFYRNLTLGSTGNDVKQLQALLVNEVNYPADLLTGYFGRITREAVVRLQEKYNIKPALGYFGEITRKALSALISN